MGSGKALGTTPPVLGLPVGMWKRLLGGQRGEGIIDNLNSVQSSKSLLSPCCAADTGQDHGKQGVDPSETA